MTTMRLLRRLKVPSNWPALRDGAFSSDVAAAVLNAELTFPHWSVYEADEDYWAKRAAATLILSHPAHEEFVGVFLDSDTLTNTMKVKLKKTPGQVLDSEVGARHLDASDFSHKSIRLLFDYMLRQYRVGGGTFTLSKAGAIAFLKDEVTKDKALRQIVFSKMSRDAHGAPLLKIWKDRHFDLSMPAP